MARRPQGRSPKKLYYKIGEVCELTDTEPYVLRYWESEFPFLAPEKNRAGQRIYSEDDIQTVNAIKRLLYEEGYTTAGARRRLEKEMAERGTEEAGVEASPPSTAASAGPGVAPAAEDGTWREAARAVRDGLRELRELLAAGDAEPSAGAAPKRRAAPRKKR